MNRKTWIVTGAVVVGSAVLLAWAFAPRPVEVDLAEARLGAFETSIEEDGRTALTLVDGEAEMRYGEMILRPKNSVSSETGTGL